MPLLLLLLLPGAAGRLRLLPEAEPPLRLLLLLDAMVAKSFASCRLICELWDPRIRAIAKISPFSLAVFIKNLGSHRAAANPWSKLVAASCFLG